MLQVDDVFVPGGIPLHTYNPRQPLGLEEALTPSKKNLHKITVVTGQTKSGKTVLARKVFPPEDSIWVEGGAVGQESHFWEVVVSELDLFQRTEETRSKETGGEVSAQLEGEIGNIITKGKASLGGKIGRTRGVEASSERSLSSRIAALQGLTNAQLPLVVDDFHFIPELIQRSILRSLKALIFGGMPVVLISIPGRRHDVPKLEKELTGRLHLVEVPDWSTDELCYIAETGFTLLHYTIDPRSARQLSAEAYGSPHLMQEFCRALYYQMNLKHSLARRKLLPTSGDLRQVFLSSAESSGQPLFERLARGPRPRKKRVQRKLKNGQTLDIYELVLHALARLKPGLRTIEYEELRQAIQEISATPTPGRHEVVRVLNQMATISGSDQSSSPVIDFNDKEGTVHITDPFFAFFLKWGRFEGSP